MLKQISGKTEYTAWVKKITELDTVLNTSPYGTLLTGRDFLEQLKFFAAKRAKYYIKKVDKNNGKRN